MFLYGDAVISAVPYPAGTLAGITGPGTSTTLVASGVTVGAAGAVVVTGALDTAVDGGVTGTGWGVSAVCVTGTAGTDTS